MSHDWDAAYRGSPPPWDIGRAQPIVVRLADEGAIRGDVLDAGCGTGENAIYLTEPPESNAWTSRIRGVQKRLGHTAERISPATFRRQEVSSVGRREPATVEPDRSLGDAISAMQAGETRSVLVTDADRRLVGVFTERDVVLRVLGEDADLSAPIERYMTRDPESVRMDDHLGHALELMEQHGYHGLPVVDADGRVAGHLDSRDILEYIAEAFPQEVLNLPPRPHQLMEQPEGA